MGAMSSYGLRWGRLGAICPIRGRYQALVSRSIVGHNRWHPDIPAAVTVKPGDAFRVHCREWFDGAIHNDDSADDILNAPLTTVHTLSGPFSVEGAKPGDLLIDLALGTLEDDGGSAVSTETGGPGPRQGPDGRCATGEQPGECGLARAVVADDGDELSSSDREVDVDERRRRCTRIGEAHVIDRRARCCAAGRAPSGRTGGRRTGRTSCRGERRRPGPAT